MSDRTLLVTVEDLIFGAFGAANKNTVNFKLVQTILHILARHLRLLEQDVEIKFNLGSDFENERSSPHQQNIVGADKYEDKYYDEDDNDTSSYSSYSSGSEDADGRVARKGRGEKGGQRDRDEKEAKREKEERGEKGEKKVKKGKHEKGEKEKEDRSKDKTKEDEGAEREGRGGPQRRGQDDKHEGGERGGPGQQHGGKQRRGQEDKDEGGKRGGLGQQHGGQQRRGQDDKDEGGERGGPGQQHGGPQRRGQEDKDEGGKRGGPGQQHGGQQRRGQDDKDEGGERGGPGQQHGGPQRRGQEDKDEGGKRGGPGQQHGGQQRRGQDDKDEGGERGGPGRQHGGPQRRGQDDKDEGGERGGPGQQHGGPQGRGRDDKDKGGERGGPGEQHGGPQRRGRDDKDMGGERGGPGEQHSGPQRRGRDDKDMGGERGGPGQQHGRPQRRVQDDKDKGGERGGPGRQHGVPQRRGQDDKDEGGERQGRRHGGRSRDREDRERRGDRHRERRDVRHGERRGDRRGEEGGEYDDQGQRRLGGRERSGTSITVTEAARKGGTGATDKVVVAERGPSKQGRVARVGSIEVVTASQFSLLARAVRQLEHVTGPLPAPALPDNQQLRAELATGRASLSDTMEAVQLNKRVQAAEEGLSRMAGLLTELAAAGVLPGDFASRIGDLRGQLRKTTSAGQVAAGRSPGPGTGSESTHFAEVSEADEEDAGAGTDQGGGPGPKTVCPVTDPARPDHGESPVTNNEMQNILEQMKETIVKKIQNLTARATHSADIASNTSRNVSEKLNIALTLDERISTLYAQTADYAEQLNGFDTGLSTQMAGFQEQMTMMKNDLRGGLELFESANNNAETTAILDLSERYQNLVLDLDTTVHLNSTLNVAQQQISTELKSIVECVEMLREQKADRDEVLDGLRDKVDITRLSGLLYEKDFAQARFEIEKRIEKSYAKFNKQDELWQDVMRDLTRITEHKAELITLMTLKDEAMKQLNGMQAKLRQLKTMLGEPQAALLTRKLAAGAACGACLTPAVMPLEDATHGKPALLPALPHAPPGAELPCFGEIVLRPPDPRKHICHRWVGGSHTLMAGNVLREMAEQSHLDTVPFKKYEGYGSDGRLYMMEEKMQPCRECNKFSTDEADTPPHSPSPAGAGDQRAAPRSHHP